MELYLSAKSKKNISYTPEYIHITLPTGIKVTLDVRGEITHSSDGLNCRVKGELIPWIITDTEGAKGVINELYKMPDELIEKWFCEALVCNSFNHAIEFMIEVYPVSENLDNTDDELTDGRGTIEYTCNNEIVTKGFIFKTEIMN